KNEYFFDTDINLRSRFMFLAPYSKFNLDIDKESPGAIGRWLGYKIVDSYMKNNKTNLNELLDLDHYTIFKKSKYKPSK
ncbi:gliding motility lipoprotein GldB, partial [Flavobacteriaceae bacterium]|nr:gliding motility lipoprotein GldB [Flavobacteriaceae bacterium]